MDSTTGNRSGRTREWILQTDRSDISISIAVRHWTVSSHSNWNPTEVEVAAPLEPDYTTVMMRNIDHRSWIASEIEEAVAFRITEGSEEVFDL